MGILSWLRSSASAESRLLTELAELTGRKQGLVDRLTRHAAMCTYPNLKAGVESLAEKEAAHVKTLNAILSARNVWSRLPEPPVHDGANNWERFGGDLELLASLAATFQRAAALWEAVDQAVADALAKLAIEDDERESELRKLALKCDPQAFD